MALRLVYFPVMALAQGMGRFATLFLSGMRAEVVMEPVLWLVNFGPTLTVWSGLFLVVVGVTLALFWLWPLLSRVGGCSPLLCGVVWRGLFWAALWWRVHLGWSLPLSLLVTSRLVQFVRTTLIIKYRAAMGIYVLL